MPVSKNKQICKFAVYKKLAECFSNMLLLLYAPFGNIWDLKLFAHSFQDCLRSLLVMLAILETHKDISL